MMLGQWKMNDGCGMFVLTWFINYHLNVYVKNLVNVSDLVSPVRCLVHVPVGALFTFQ